MEVPGTLEIDRLARSSWCSSLGPQPAARELADKRGANASCHVPLHRWACHARAAVDGGPPSACRHEATSGDGMKAAPAGPEGWQLRLLMAEVDGVGDRERAIGRQEGEAVPSRPASIDTARQAGACPDPALRPQGMSPLLRRALSPKTAWRRLRA